MAAADRVSRVLRRRPLAVAYGDLPALGRPARRTRLVRILIAVAIAGLLIGAVLTAGGNGRAQSDLVPSGTTSVLVVDVSRSIIDTELASVRATFNRLISTDTPTGLVLFSDVAYELLPPGSPASALAPVVRLFTPRKGVYPRNPWEGDIQGGDEIRLRSSLLARCSRACLARGSILLVSDLETAPSDYAKLAQTLTMLTRENVLVRAVPCIQRTAPRSCSALFSATTIAAPSRLDESPDTTTVRRTLSGDFAPSFLVVGSLLLLGLAANERWCTRLTLPLTESGEGQ